MRIGEFARRAGISASAVRFYEKQGLMPRSRRLDNGYRDYDEDDLRIVRLIDRARSLGFSLGDVQRFMSRSPEERANKARLLPMLADKLARLDEHLLNVQRQRDALFAFMDTIRRA